MDGDIKNMFIIVGSIVITLGIAWLYDEYVIEKENKK